MHTKCYSFNCFVIVTYDALLVCVKLSSLIIICNYFSLDEYSICCYTILYIADGKELQINCHCNICIVHNEKS